MFKVNDKNTRMTLVFLLLTLKIFHTFSIVNFEEVDVSGEGIAF